MMPEYQPGDRCPLCGKTLVPGTDVLTGGTTAECPTMVGWYPDLGDSDSLSHFTHFGRITRGRVIKAIIGEYWLRWCDGDDKMNLYLASEPGREYILPAIPIGAPSEMLEKILTLLSFQ